MTVSYWHASVSAGLLLQDNELRLASLLQITSINLDDILSAIAAEETPDKEALCHRVVSCMCLYVNG